MTVIYLFLSMLFPNFDGFNEITFDNVQFDTTLNKCGNGQDEGGGR